MSAPRELRHTTHPSTTTRAVGQAITALIQRLTNADEATRAHLVEQFWQNTAAGAPLVEPAPAEPGMNVVTFVWRGDAHAALVTVNRVTNDLESSRMQRIAGTDIWHTGFLLADDWRGSYTMMAVDADGLAELEDAGPRAAMGIIRARGVPDPRNPNSTFTHGCRVASVAQLAAAPQQVWFTAPSTDTAPAVGEEHLLPNGRRVWVHDPRPGAAGPRPLVINLDGDVWYRSGYAATTVDALVDRAAVPAPLVVMIDPGSNTQRTADLHIDGPMAAELVDIVLPWTRAHLPVSERAEDVVVCGESLGGLTALKVAFDYPHLVGAALAQSSSLWQHGMLDRVAQATADTRLYLTVGSKESLLLEPNRALANALDSSPVRHTYVEFNGGHDMACWRGYYGDGLLQLLGR